MRAAVFHTRNEPLTIEDVEPVAPGPTDVVVRLGASGLCHSDLNAIDGKSPLMPPSILGHEGAGVVEEVGERVTSVRVGDRVIGTSFPACGSCWSCLHGYFNMCDEMAGPMSAVRVHRGDGTPVSAMAGLGTFAETMICSERSVVRVDTDLPDEQLALIGCGVTTGVGAALNTVDIEPGSTVVVIGCGGVGQGVVQGARIAGAGRIIGIDPVPFKRETAQALGATDVLDPGAGDVVEAVKSLTDGRGADYAFEVTGVPELVAQAIAAVRKGGAAIMVGIGGPAANVTFPTHPFVMQQKRLLGSLMGVGYVRREYPRLISLVESGQLDVGAMVTGSIRLEDVNEGFDAMRSGSVIRSVILH